MLRTEISPRINSTARLIFPFFLVLLVTAPSYAGLKEGLADYDKANYAAARNELAPLAEKGNAVAQYRIGRMYSLGQGVPKDDRVAAEWFLKSAQQGSAEAQGMLGYMYLVGEGAPQSNGKAYEWFRRAADQGDASAQYNLGVMFGGKGIEKDPAKAAQWMRKAAEQGHRYAQSTLGYMYQHGDGVAKDPVLAYMLYALSGKSGNIGALTSQNDVAARMTPAQIKEAGDLAIEWKKGDPIPVESRTSKSRIVLK